MVEVDAASQVIEKTRGHPFVISPILQNVAGNVIHGIVFGKRYNYDDPDFDIVRSMSSTFVSAQGVTSLGLFFPIWVTWLLSLKEGKKAQIRQQTLKNIQEFILVQVKEHEESYDENIIRDFVDLYINVTRDSTEETFSKTNICRIILELFVAGSETTYNTLDWAFLCMVEHPEIQRKFQQEIAETVGNRSINYADRVDLSYIDATITEVQRYASIVPLSLQHCTSKDTTLMGYHIPKNTVILPSLYSANMDPNYWKEPTKFKPDRFLDSKGKLVKKKALMPFSVGPRTCLGEPLARMELFLVFANLLQKFTFERECDDVRHVIEPKPSDHLVSSPCPFKIRVKKR